MWLQDGCLLGTNLSFELSWVKLASAKTPAYVLCGCLAQYQAALSPSKPAELYLAHKRAASSQQSGMLASEK